MPGRNPRAPRPLPRSSMPPNQLSLLEPGPALPAGFRYRAGLVSPHQERDLLDGLAGLAFAAFEFRGHAGNRRVISFGWAYDFNTGELRRAEAIPPFLLSLRDAAAGFAGLAPSGLQHALVTEYPPGAGMGWHRDKTGSGTWWACRSPRLACSACGGRRAPTGSGRRSSSSRAPPICCVGRLGPSGSTASRPRAGCATRSPSGACVRHEPGRRSSGRGYPGRAVRGHRVLDVDPAHSSAAAVLREPRPSSLTICSSQAERIARIRAFSSLVGSVEVEAGPTSPLFRPHLVRGPFALGPRNSKLL